MGGRVDSVEGGEAGGTFGLTERQITTMERPESSIRLTRMPLSLVVARIEVRER